MARKPSFASGMTQVDAYMVANERVTQYIAEREQLAATATALLAPYCATVSRCWQGSQDGEAVVGYDAAGDIIARVHLDPDGIALLKKPAALRGYLQLPNREAEP